MTGKELKAKYEAKVAELDKQLEIVNAKLDAVPQDSEEFQQLYDQAMDIMCQTNKYLRAMGADESQMYDL